MRVPYSNNEVYSKYSDNVECFTSNPSIGVLRKRFEFFEH